MGTSIAPTIGDCFTNEMIYNPDESIKGDCIPVPRGAAAILIKDMAQQRRMQFLGMTANPIDMAIIGNKGDNAKTDAIIKTNVASNQWGYYQAKGIKGSVATSEHELLTLLSPSQAGGADAAKVVERLNQIRDVLEPRQA